MFFEQHIICWFEGLFILFSGAYINPGSNEHLKRAACDNFFVLLLLKCFVVFEASLNFLTKKKKLIN